MIFLTYTNPVFWIALKRNTFRMSLPKVIMIANTFTMSILRVLLKPNTFVVSFPEMIMIANVFTSQKHQISKKTQKKMLGFKAKLKNDVTRQAKFVGDSYSSKTTPFKYATIHITCFKPLWEMCRANAKLI